MWGGGGNCRDWAHKAPPAALHGAGAASAVGRTSPARLAHLAPCSPRTKPQPSPWQQIACPGGTSVQLGLPSPRWVLASTRWGDFLHDKGHGDASGGAGAGRAEHFVPPAACKRRKGAGGELPAPRHTQGTQERGRDVLSVTRHAGRLGQAVPAGTRLPARASTALPRAKGAPGHCQKSVGRRARGWHCCGLHGARLGLLQHPWMLLEVDEHCVTISAPSLQAWRSRCPGIPLHQGPENSSPHPVGPHRPGREERTPATRLLAGQGD